MKLFQIILPLIVLTSCKSNSIKSPISFERLLPDTSNTWSGRMTKEHFHYTRTLESKFKLNSLYNGATKQEIRIWDLHGYYSPESLIILKQENNSIWNLRSLTFYHSANDSLGRDSTKTIPSAIIDNLNLSQYWNLASQSDMKFGDSYGCNDGNSFFVEISDSLKYRFMWYRCPTMHQRKDSAFLKIVTLSQSLDSLAFNIKI